MTAPARTSYRGGLGVAVIALVVAGWMGLWQAPRNPEESFARTGGPPVSTSLAGIQLRDTANVAVPLAPRGQSAVLMISSVTCSWCKRALRDLGEMSNGRPLPGLRLITFEGAAGGAGMLSAAGVSGALSAGPTSATGTIMSLQFPGTPIFLVVDTAGRVVKSVPGYPGRAGMVPLMRVMLAAADSGAAQGVKLTPR